MEIYRKQEFEIYFKKGMMEREHMHQDVELVYVMEGRVRIQVLGKYFDLKSEDTIVINSNHRHSWSELEPSYLCIIHFNYSMLLEHMDKQPELTVTWFQPDEKKDGGAYLTTTGRLKKLRELERLLLLADGTEIPLEDVVALESDIFQTLM